MGIVLVCMDGREVEADGSMMMHSRLLQRISEGHDGCRIPLGIILSPVLMLLMELSGKMHDREACACRHSNLVKWKGELMQNTHQLMSGHAWLTSFFSELDHQSTIDLLQAANFLEFEEGVEVICKHVALIIRGKSPEDIRELFSLPTPS